MNFLCENGGSSTGRFLEISEMYQRENAKTARKGNDTNLG